MKRLSLSWLLLLCFLFALALVIYYKIPIQDFVRRVENEEVVTSQDITGLPVEGEMTIEGSNEEENKSVVEEEMLSPAPVDEEVGKEIEEGSDMPSVGIEEVEKGNTEEGTKVNADEELSSEPREGVMAAEVYKVLIFIIIVGAVVYKLQPKFFHLLVRILIHLLVLILIIVSVFWVSCIGFKEEKWIYRLGCDTSRIRRRKVEGYRFLTCGWIHKDEMHLYGNMRELFIAGCGCIYTLAELFSTNDAFSPVKVSFLLLFTYVVGIILGGLYGYLIYDDEDDVIKLGASEGVAAIWGFFLMLRFRAWEADGLWCLFLCAYPAFLVILISLDVFQAIKSKIEDDQSAEYLVAHQEHVVGSIWGAVMAIVVRNYQPGIRKDLSGFADVVIIMIIFCWFRYPPPIGFLLPPLRDELSWQQKMLEDMKQKGITPLFPLEHLHSSRHYREGAVSYIREVGS